LGYKKKNAMPSLEGKLNNAQRELLLLFSENLSEADLLFLKKVLLRFKAERLMDQADAIWKKKDWTTDDVKRLLNIKMRTPYRSVK
jgi:hypothetical protein